MFRPQGGGGCACTDEATGQPENEPLQILCQFDRMYECRIAEVDADPDVPDNNRAELKLKITTDWVRDLREQNTMLVQTVHDLEQTAVCRVKLLENKLQETSNVMSHNILHSDKSEEDLNALSNRVCQLANDLEDVQRRKEYLENDIKNLLELIKRGRIDNNWNLDGLTFYEIQPSDIPAPPDCTCSQITNLIENEESAFDKRNSEIAKLRDQLCSTRMKMDYLQKKIEEKCIDNRNLKENLACLHKKSLELTDKIRHLEYELQCSEEAVSLKDGVIMKMRCELKKANEKAPTATRRVTISTEPCKKMENPTIEDNKKININDSKKQIEELQSLLVLKNDEISKLRSVLNEKSNQTFNRRDENLLCSTSTDNQVDVLAYLTNLIASMENEKETVDNLKIEYETTVNKLNQTTNMYQKDIALVNEMLQDIQTYLCKYRTEVIEHNQCRDITKVFISGIESEIRNIQKMFKNKCEICVKENVLSEIKEVISKITSGIQTLMQISNNKNASISTIKTMVKKTNVDYNISTAREYEQKAIFAAILQQFRMMEEFRICTVEVQAATEDLREEVSAVISNLNSRHCKYLELTKMVSQVQDYLTRTRENISEVINRLELQDEERARHSERITNSGIRLKDIKNEFIQTQSQLSKCLNNVHNNIQQTNLLDYAEIHTCNDLLFSVVEEVEQIVSNLHTFQTQGCCTLSTMIELKKQLIVMEHNVKELKKKSDHVLIENEAAQKSFTERSKKLEKYECEVDNCHTKMQDVLECIIATRDQMSEFGCIQETENSFQSTNETIKMKDDLRKLHKECEELNFQMAQVSHVDKQEKAVSEWENRITDLQDQIQVLQNEIKYKQDANIFLKQSIELLEKELVFTRAKAEEYRRCSSTESLALKKKLFELENYLRVKKDTENNLKCLANNETDSKKSLLLDYATKDRINEGNLKRALQEIQENIPQRFKILQDTIQAIKSGLQELGDELNQLISEGPSHSCSSNDSIKTVQRVESTNSCPFDVEKIKDALHSKDKLMANIDEIIRIQKDSIVILQSGVEDLHKTLQAKIHAQEKAITDCETEKRQLHKQIELQVQTIGHLQDAVVETKKNIDQLSNKATSDNFNKSQMLRSLNLYLTETESQYDDCYGEEELQSQARKIVDMKTKEDELVHQKNCFEKENTSLRTKCQNINEELNRLRCDFQKSVKKLSFEKQCEIEKLITENEDLKKQLQTYKMDLDFIEEEIKKMGSIDPSIESFKAELDTMRSKNETFRCYVEYYKKIIKELKCTNDCLSKKLHALESCKNIGADKSKEKIFILQREICLKSEKIKNLNSQVSYSQRTIKDQLKVIEDLTNKLSCQEHRIKDCFSELDSSKETIHHMRSDIETLKQVLEKNLRCISKLEENKDCLIQTNNILEAKIAVIKDKSKNDICCLQYQLKQTRGELAEIQEKYKNVSQRLKTHLRNFDAKRCNAIDHPQAIANPNTCNCNQSKKIEELQKCLKETREELSAKCVEFNSLINKYESSEQRCRQQKDTIMQLEKNLGCFKEKLQTCSDKNADFVRQNKLLEENNNKCMTELEDIVLQLEDMQSSLVDLRSECDTKAQSLECVSVELAKMKVSRSEVCEESKYVLEWVRFWMREQKQTASKLQDKLREKQQQLLRISSEKKNFMVLMKRLKRVNRILIRRLKLIRKPSAKQIGVVHRNNHLLPSQQTKKSSVNQGNEFPNGFYSLCSTHQQKSSAVYSHFKRECREGTAIVKHKGDYKYFRGLKYLTNELPKLSQMHQNVRTEDTADYGYQTSSSK